MKFMPKKNKKGFTILELLVVVAIIAILAVIAIPQFMGAIDKSRVSAQIADCASVSKAVVMYNFDTSDYPASPVDAAAVTALQGTANNAKGWIQGTSAADNALLTKQDPDTGAVYTEVPGYNGPYVTAYPAQNKWGGAFTYMNLTATPAGGTPELEANLANGNVVIKLTGLSATMSAKLDAATDGTAGATAGTFRTNTAGTIGYYVIK